LGEDDRSLSYGIATGPSPVSYWIEIDLEDDGECMYRRRGDHIPGQKGDTGRVTLLGSEDWESDDLLQRGAERRVEQRVRAIPAEPLAGSAPKV
jgi:hypothetical protein